ncbi:MAG: hypothetical protein WAK01_00465 [Methylocystis sp.]
MSAEVLLPRSIAAFACGAALAAAAGPVLAFTLSESALPKTGAAASLHTVLCGWDACGWVWGPAAVINGIIAGSDIGPHAVVTAAPYQDYPAYDHVQRHYDPRSSSGCRRRWRDPYGRAHWRRAC